MPQRPQWAVLVSVLTQAVLQKVVPGAQAMPQVPLTHDWPVGQALPQRPQWAALVWKLTQAEPQRLSPVPQVQRPAVQVPPAPQELPQAPQLAVLVAVLTREPRRRAGGYKGGAEATPGVGCCQRAATPRDGGALGG